MSAEVVLYHFAFQISEPAASTHGCIQEITADHKNQPECITIMKSKEKTFI